MFSRSSLLIKQCGMRYMSSKLGRAITSQSAYLVSEETPLTKFFTGVPKLETIEPRKLWINEAMETMTSIEEARNILSTFQQKHYFINNKAIKSFVTNGLNISIRQTIDVICDPSIHLPLNNTCITLIKKKLKEEGDGDYAAKFDEYIAAAKDVEAEEPEQYTPYEHLRTVTENSDFYTMDFTIDIKRDILGTSEYLVCNKHTNSQLV